MLGHLWQGYRGITWPDYWALGSLLRGASTTEVDQCLGLCQVLVICWLPAQFQFCWRKLAWVFLSSLAQASSWCTCTAGPVCGMIFFSRQRQRLCEGSFLHLFHLVMVGVSCWEPGVHQWVHVQELICDRVNVFVFRVPQYVFFLFLCELSAFLLWL